MPFDHSMLNVFQVTECSSGPAAIAASAAMPTCHLLLCMHYYSMFMRTVLPADRGPHLRQSCCAHVGLLFLALLLEYDEEDTRSKRGYLFVSQAPRGPSD